MAGELLHGLLECGPGVTDVVDSATKRVEGTPSGELIGQLVQTHRKWAGDLARIEWLLDRVEAEGVLPAQIRAVRNVFALLSYELDEHIKSEENVLFPAILEMERNAQRGGPMPELAFGSVRNPITMMDRDHEGGGRLRARLHELTGGYIAGASASPSLRELYGALRELDQEIEQHCALEEEVLFPRAVRLERGQDGNTS